MNVGYSIRLAEADNIQIGEMPLSDHEEALKFYNPTKYLDAQKRFFRKL